MDHPLDQFVVKRVLLIAYHYPPIRVSSGLQRTLKFSQHLPGFGWRPSVLTVHPRAYEVVSDDQMREIPPDIIVERAFALDTGRHLAILGRYSRLLSLPDRWVSWWLGGVLRGLWLVQRERSAVLWSTYPIATAHLIGLTLHRLTGIPWVADFRDSMTEPDYPSDKHQRRVFRWIERQTVIRCSRAVFTTPGALRMYAERYPDIPRSRWMVVANGYDEDNFARAEERMATCKARHMPLILVHSGMLYPGERDPRPFFGALADLKRSGVISSANLRIVLRASDAEDYHHRHIREYGIQDMVSLEPGVSYEAALQEMINADGLLIFQAASCNHQIPAKVYEYLRAQRPIFALTDRAGDTAGVLRAAGIDSIVPLDDRESIARGLEEFLNRVRDGSAVIPAEAEIICHSRRSRARELASLLDDVIGIDIP